MGDYLRPTALADALAALADAKLTGGNAGNLNGQGLTVLAGGTDFYPAQTARTAWLEATPRNMLDISGIDELRGIRQDERRRHLRGARTWAEIRDAPLPRGLRRV